MKGRFKRPTTGTIIAVEGFSTVVASLFGGVIQSTPYIGHPAYKAMGARAGYTLATALFVGAAAPTLASGWAGVALALGATYACFGSSPAGTKAAREHAIWW